jgi:hypothetical protein
LSTSDEQTAAGTNASAGAGEIAALDARVDALLRDVDATLEAVTARLGPSEGEVDGETEAVAAEPAAITEPATSAPATGGDAGDDELDAMFASAESVLGIAPEPTPAAPTVKPSAKPTPTREEVDAADFEEAGEVMSEVARTLETEPEPTPTSTPTSGVEPEPETDPDLTPGAAEAAMPTPAEEEVAPSAPAASAEPAVAAASTEVEDEFVAPDVAISAPAASPAPAPSSVSPATGPSSAALAESAAEAAPTGEPPGVIERLDAALAARAETSLEEQQQAGDGTTTAAKDASSASLAADDPFVSPEELSADFAAVGQEPASPAPAVAAAVAAAAVAAVAASAPPAPAKPVPVKAKPEPAPPAPSAPRMVPRDADIAGAVLGGLGGSSSASVERSVPTPTVPKPSLGVRVRAAASKLGASLAGPLRAALAPAARLTSRMSVGVRQTIGYVAVLTLLMSAALWGFLILRGPAKMPEPTSEPAVFLKAGDKAPEHHAAPSGSHASPSKKADAHASGGGHGSSGHGSGGHAAPTPAAKSSAKKDDGYGSSHGSSSTKKTEAKKPPAKKGKADEGHGGGH